MDNERFVKFVLPFILLLGILPLLLFFCGIPRNKNKVRGAIL